MNTIKQSKLRNTFCDWLAISFNQPPSYKAYILVFLFRLLLALSLFLSWTGSAQSEEQAEIKTNQSADVPQVILRSQPTLAAQAEPVLTQISGFHWQGHRMLDTATLNAIVQQHLPMPLPAPHSIDSVNRLLKPVMARYHELGFGLALAFVPAHQPEIAQGIVVIQVVEGELGRLWVDNQSRMSSVHLTRIIQRNLCDDPLSCAGQTVHLPQLSNTLRVINSLPGVYAEAALTPGRVTGTTDLTVKAIAAQPKPYHVTLALNNDGNPSTGRVQSSLTLDLTNPSGTGDRASLAVQKAKLSTNYTFDYDSPMGNWVGGVWNTPQVWGDYGWRSGVFASRGHYQIGGAASVLGLSGQSQAWGLRASYPLARTVNTERTLRLSYQHARFDSTLSGVSHSSALQASVHDRAPNRSWSVQLEMGMLSSQDAEQQWLDSAYGGYKTLGDYAKLNVSSQWQWPMDANWSLNANFSAQQALGRNLGDGHKFSISGPTGVRAYATGEGRGDAGALVILDLRRRWRTTSAEGSTTLFWDWGSTKFSKHGATDIDPSSGGNSYSHLQGWGLSFDVIFSQRAYAKWWVAYPLSKQKAVLDIKTPRLGAEVGAVF